MARRRSSDSRWRHRCCRESLPFTADVDLDLRVLAFAAAIALGVGAARRNASRLANFLRQSGGVVERGARGSSGGHIRRCGAPSSSAKSRSRWCWFAGALLLFRSLLKLQQLDTGVRIENVITMSVDLPLRRYPTPAAGRARSTRRSPSGFKPRPESRRPALSTHLPLQWISNGESHRSRGRREAGAACGSNASTPAISARSEFPCSPAAASPDATATGAPRRGHQPSAGRAAGGCRRL